MYRINATAWSWHRHKFHHLYLNHDVEEKSDQHEQERDYVVPAVPPLLMLECPPEVTTFHFDSAIEPSVASTRVLVHLGLSIWPVVIHSWNSPNEHGVAVIRHL